MTIPAAPSPELAPLPKGDSFVYVKIPLQRSERRQSDPLHRREDQIDEALRAQGLGTVIGWGDSLGEANAQGQRSAAFLRIDILTRQTDDVRALLHHLLPTLGAQLGTEIHYTGDANQALLDRGEASHWQLAERRPMPSSARPRGL